MKKFLQYTSEKVVVLHEKGMAIAYHLIIFLLLCFLIIYIGIIKDAHKNTFNSTATIITSLIGKTYGFDPTASKLSFFDQGDLTDPFMTEDSFFIPTELYVVNSKQDICGRPCSSEEDCPNVPSFTEPVCSNGFCQELNLCPVDAQKFDFYQIAGAELMTLKLVTIADFPGYSDYVYRRASANNIIMYPKKNPTGYTVQDLLSFAGLKIADVADTGAVLRLNIILQCDLDSEKCRQDLNVQRIDVGSNTLLPVKSKKVAFFQEYAIQNKDNPDQVDNRILVGLKFLINTQVTAKKFSVNLLFILIGAAFGCIAFGAILMDWIMLHFLPEPRRKNFFKRKYLNSEDFSDLKDRLEEVRKLRKQQFDEYEDEEDQDD